MNKWWSRNLKWMVAVSALLVLVATAPVVSAGRRWSGIDPVLQVNGDRFNISVFWPEEFDCYIDGIDFTVTVPRGADAEVLDESKGKFACGDGEYNEIETDTDIVYKGKGSRVGIFAYVTADGERFPVRVLVTRNGAPERVCRGWSNSTVKCQTTISSTDRDRDDRDRDDRDRDDRDDDDEDDDDEDDDD